jgi:hypothetical protein
MSRDLNALESPGEDSFDLPQSLGWFVAACTLVRHLVVGVGDTLGPPTLRRRLSGIPGTGGSTLAADPG